MNKLQMAHEYAKISVSAMLNDVPDSDINFEMVAMNAFGLADAMFAEFEKRQDKSRPAVLEDWQPDWSLAPENAVACAMDADKSMWWHKVIPERYEYRWSGLAIGEYENHGYQGDWRDSLRIRPEGV